MLFNAYYVISFKEWWYGIEKPQRGYPENRITLSKIESIKKEKLIGF